LGIEPLDMAVELVQQWWLLVLEQYLASEKEQMLDMDLELALGLVPVLEKQSVQVLKVVLDRE
jgi:hypothetical protein